MKILIVDDELISRQKLAVQLRKKGHCDLAEDGMAAYEMFRRAFENDDAYDLITLDFNMPGISGPELLEKIRNFEERNGIVSREKWVKVVMVTAKDDTKSVMSSYLSGCEEYLVKPFNPEELKKCLAKLSLKRHFVQ
jgi:DNA-binding response OmpR family regulator